MIYPKGRRLDSDSNTEFRILMMEEQRASAVSLMISLKHYSQVLEQLSTVEQKVVADLARLYPTESIFASVVHNLHKAMSFKAEIVRREVKSLRTSLELNRSLGEMFSPLKPLINNYFKCVDANEHYSMKMPKLVDTMDGKRRMKGDLHPKDVERLNRNNNKLESARSDLRVAHESVYLETNRLNLYKFDKLNEATREFINSQLSMTFLMTEKFGVLDNFDELLSGREDQQFNTRYFGDINEAKKSLTHSTTRRKTSHNGETLRQSIPEALGESDRYRIFREEKGKGELSFGSNDDLANGESQFFFSQYSMANSNSLKNARNHANQNSNFNQNHSGRVLSPRRQFIRERFSGSQGR